MKTRFPKNCCVPTVHAGMMQMLLRKAVLLAAKAFPAKTVRAGKSQLLVLGLLLPGVASPQTCCSGGVPTSSNLGLPATSSRSLQFSLTYDFNELNTQQTGRQEAGRPQSFRRTQSLMLQAGYQSGKAWGVDVFLPWIQQERRSNLNNDVNTTDGLGDAVLLFKYQLLRPRLGSSSLSLGIGPELPTGRADFRAEDGTLLLADMQPGSGSWDALFWAQYNHPLPFWPSASAFLQGTYKTNGKNKDLGSKAASLTYQFGDEWQLIGGINNRFLIAGRTVDFGLTLRYRRAAFDRSKPNGIPQPLAELPNTGGQWLFVNPSLAYWFSPDCSVTLTAAYPLLADVGGTQVTPTYRLNASIFYHFDWQQPSDTVPGQIQLPRKD